MWLVRDTEQGVHSLLWFQARYRMDKEINNRTCDVIKDGRFVCSPLSSAVMIIALLLSFATDLELWMIGKVQLCSLLPV